MRTGSARGHCHGASAYVTGDKVVFSCLQRLYEASEPTQTMIHGGTIKLLAGMFSLMF